jgi:hypothetical protein
MRDHRTAVAHSWRELCRAERLARAVPGVGDARLEPARDNATAALHNLALAYARRAMLACLAGPAPTPTGRVANVRRQAALAWARIDFAAADRIFRAPLEVAGDRTERAIASHFERGVALEHNG